MNQINRENISLFKLSKLIYQQLSYKRKRQLILVIFFYSIIFSGFKTINLIGATLVFSYVFSNIKNMIILGLESISF